MIAQVSDSMVKIVCGFSYGSNGSISSKMRYSSSFVSVRSMAIRVSRKLGIPLKSGLAARWRRTCSMPRRSSSRLTRLHFLAEYVQPPFGTQRREFFARLQIMLHFLKEPRAAEAGTAYHDGVHTVEVEAFFGPLGSGDITVADDGNGACVGSFFTSPISVQSASPVYIWRGYGRGR